MDVHFTLFVAAVVADETFCGIEVAISDVVRALRNALGTIYVINKERLAVRSEPLRVLSEEAAIASRGVLPLLFMKFKLVVEEVLAFDELSAVPLGNVLAL